MTSGKLVKTGGYIHECPLCKCKQCGQRKIDHTTEQMDKCNNTERALAIFNSDKSPLDFIVKSNGSVSYTPSHCERCKKKFRFYRKEHLIYDKTETVYHSWKLVCIDCINLESDSF